MRPLGPAGRQVDMFELILIAGLITGLRGSKFAGDKFVRVQAMRFTAWWSVGLSLFIVGALIYGASMPDRPQNGHPATLLIAIIWLSAATTHAWAITTTLWKIWKR